MTNSNPPGPTDDFPKGKICEEDEGGLNIAIGVDPETRNVILNFGVPVNWIGMEVDEALGLAKLITEKANELKAMVG